VADQDIRLGGAEFNMFSSIAIISSLEGAKVYSQIGWGAMGDFPLDICLCRDTGIIT